VEIANSNGIHPKGANAPRRFFVALREMDTVVSGIDGKGGCARWSNA
jgi:hypothetical protein